MTLATKLLIVLICISLCGGGAIISMRGTSKQNRAKSKVVPINNRAKGRAIWIWSQVEIGRAWGDALRSVPKINGT